MQVQLSAVQEEYQMYKARAHSVLKKQKNGVSRAQPKFWSFLARFVQPLHCRWRGRRCCAAAAHTFGVSKYGVCRI